MVFKWRSLFFFVLGIYPRPSVSALDMEMKRNEGESHKLLIVLFFPLKKNSTEQRGLENETTKSCCFSESRRQLSGGPCRLFRKFFFLLSFTCVSEEIEFKMACLWYKTTPATNETRGREKVLGRERVRVQRTTYIYTALFSLTLVERELPPLSLFLSLFFLLLLLFGVGYIFPLWLFPPFFFLWCRKFRRVVVVDALIPQRIENPAASAAKPINGSGGLEEYPPLFIFALPQIHTHTHDSYRPTICISSISKRKSLRGNVTNVLHLNKNE